MEIRHFCIAHARDTARVTYLHLFFRTTPKSPVQPDHVTKNPAESLEIPRFFAGQAPPVSPDQWQTRLTKWRVLRGLLRSYRQQAARFGANDRMRSTLRNLGRQRAAAAAGTWRRHHCDNKHSTWVRTSPSHQKSGLICRMANNYRHAIGQRTSRSPCHQTRHATDHYRP
jgi:hypothetical protein